MMPAQQPGGIPLAVDRIDAPPAPFVLDRHAAPESGAEADERLWGESLLGLLRRLFSRTNAAIERFLPAELNPVRQAGGVTAASLAIALISGILLLFWYVPTTESAYSSVEAMAASPLSAGLMRTLHRVSSDACVLFAIIHALDLLASRRLTGPRWLAWASGVGLFATLWGIGWIGYWLVWDQRALRIAEGSAALLDSIPLFSEPLARSFLAGDPGSLLFFIIFFGHILIPLLMAGALLIHLARVARPKLVIDKRLAWGLLGFLVVLSLIQPATSAAPASVALGPRGTTVDAWYLLPLWAFDRLSGPALWALAGVSSAVLCFAPWWIRRKRPIPALVNPERCDACARCVSDCPYGAISMVDAAGGGGKRVALVNPDRCVSCGICTGACNPSAVELPGFPTAMARRAVDRVAGAGVKPILIFACKEAHVPSDLESSLGVIRVPCVGWLSPRLIERAFRRGAGRIVVLSCGDDCRYREGGRHAWLRMGGVREPALRSKFRDPGLLEIRPPLPAEPSRARKLAGAAFLGTTLAAAIGFASEVPYQVPSSDQGELVVSFHHQGKSLEGCRPPTAAELEGVPPHMRPKEICPRGKAPVRVRVMIDGAIAHEKAYAPRGLFGDGASVAIVRMPVPAGRPHEVSVAIGDTSNPEEWSHRTSDTLVAAPGERRVILFDTTIGFRVR